MYSLWLSHVKDFSSLKFRKTKWWTVKLTYVNNISFQIYSKAFFIDPCLIFHCNVANQLQSLAPCHFYLIGWPSWELPNGALLMRQLKEQLGMCNCWIRVKAKRENGWEGRESERLPISRGSIILLKRDIHYHLL